MRPLLAATVDDIRTQVTVPVLLSPKIDGVRCIALNGAPMSRSAKMLPNYQLRDLFCDHRLEGFDGELVIGEPWEQDVFNRTTSTVMSYKTEITDLRFMVFDSVTEPGEFIHRQLVTRDKIMQLNLPWLHFIPQLLCNTHQDIEEFEELYLARGYEGVMLRSLHGRYKHGRSTINEQILMKLKRFTDADAEVIGYEELMHNDNEATQSETGYQVRSSHQDNMRPGGKLGALVCKWENGMTFKIGTGLDEYLRTSLWFGRHELVGKFVKFKYQPHGMKDVPRLPVFLGLRDSRDM